MNKFTSKDDIWRISPTKKHREMAAAYASRTLPWTFNRMSKLSSAKGQLERAINIVKGIAAQETLREKLRSVGIDCPAQKKSHRDEDLFDFHLNFGGTPKKYDVKSMAYYNNYPNDVRVPLTPAFIEKNRSYSGPDWRNFFPMLVPHTQINQPKEGYLFAISESVDIRKTVLDRRDFHFICAFPYGDDIAFFTNRRLCAAREETKQGFYLSLELSDGAAPMKVRVLYEWVENGTNKSMTEEVTVRSTSKTKRIGPMSVLNCVELPEDQYRQFEGLVILHVDKNELRRSVLDSQMRDINKSPSDPLVYSHADFGNLVLPIDYIINFIGWLAKDEFLRAFQNYPAWVWPIDKKNRFENSPWSQVTENDVRLLEKLGVKAVRDGSTKALCCGLMKTSGLGQGACCYVFPNIFRTGLKETNLYVLPKDLWTMDSLSERSRGLPTPSKNGKKTC
jgi:hypothetical protein